MSKIYDDTDIWLNIKNTTSNKYKLAKKVITLTNEIYYYNGKTNLYNYSEDEINCADWILKNFGGELYINFVINSIKSIKIADFTYTNKTLNLNNELLELKTPVGKRLDTIKHRIYNSKNQSRNFIIDVSNMKNINIESICRLLFKLISEKKWINIIIIKNSDKLVKVYRRK